MKVYKPEDLQNGEIKKSSSPLFAVFGKPIEHSLSPLMQNAALSELSKYNPIYADSRYLPFEIEADELSDALKLFLENNFLGINLTIPHKVKAMKILDDFDVEAKLAGACNTLLRTNRGWKGFNTDGFGLETAVEKSFGRKIRGANVAILGAGGAARGAAFKVCSSGCKSLKIFNRSRERLEDLAADLRAAGFGEKLEIFPSEDIEGKIPSGTVIVNATSVGLREFDESVLDFSKLPLDTVFFDMPYRRGELTSSVRAAIDAGIPASDGLPMLAWQGAKSFSIWTGTLPPGELMLKTLIDDAK